MGDHDDTSIKPINTRQSNSLAEIAQKFYSASRNGSNRTSYSSSNGSGQDPIAVSDAFVSAIAGEIDVLRRRGRSHCTSSSAGNHDIEQGYDNDGTGGSGFGQTSTPVFISMKENSHDESGRNADALLEELEDIFVRDVVEENGHTGAEDEPPPETFLQAVSLDLLPLLITLPTTEASTAERVLKLLILLSQRGNAKELWLALEGCLANLPLDLETGEVDVEDEGGLCLLRLLVAARIVLPRLRTNKLEKLVQPVVESLTATLAVVSEKLQTVVWWEETQSVELPVDLVLQTLLGLLGTILDRLPRPVEGGQNAGVSGLDQSLQTLLLSAVQTLVPFHKGLTSDVPGSSLTSRYFNESRPQGLLSKGKEKIGATETAASSTEEAVWSKILILARRLAVLNCDEIFAIRSPGMNPSGDSARHWEARILILARYISSSLDESLAFSFAKAYRILQFAWLACNQLLQTMVLDAALFLLWRRLDASPAVTAEHTVSEVKSEKAKEERDFSTKVLQDVVKLMANNLELVPAHLGASVLRLLSELVVKTTRSRPDLRCSLVSTLLKHEKLPAQMVGVGIVKSMLLERPSQAQSDPALTASLPLVFAMPPVLQQDSAGGFLLNDKLQTLLVGKLNLLWLLLHRSRSILQTEIMQAIQGQFLQPLRAAVVEAQRSMPDEPDIAAVMALNILEDVLSRVESELQ